ncbi:MAG: ATP-dependent transcriptional regulator [Mycobacterium sp.]|jgi:DNA-binding CsgD family transcriptional regulator/tetratricopeptide (TPR) repeat protein|uniref:helix-turn-helix transcriptional regulator n=1 Tax=Mycobacterium sp. TaxID=1785 RepID=UPI002606EFC0|nr:LuxR family transcriptional regulator [Mycobacterium sp.]MCW2663012.1 ATP-dependent transcriptional regulator [Mycobacterium sp.]
MVERIVSRQAEERALVDFLDSALREPSALVIEGEPGIGKTTLWLDAVDRARERGFRVLTSRAAAAESVLAYTALADLLTDVDDAIWADLPGPQQQGLDAALLRRRNDTHDTDARAVAAAFLAVIDRLAGQGPVLVAVDDLQWMDTSSANVISFAARRLPQGAALLCTIRTDEAAPGVQLPSPDATRRIRLHPLTVGELHQLLALRVGSSLARPMLLRIHEISGGNPFFALELTREIETDRRTTELSWPSSLSDLVSSRISRAGAGAEDALLAMASLPDPTVQVVAQAIDTAPDRVVELLGDAETHVVVAIDGNRLRFTHPVLAHGVYRGAAPRRRRAMHRRLAELVTEPELRARHLALSDTTGEPQTIEALDTAAEIARSRGAPAAAAELLELAIGLDGDTPERRIRCAHSYFFAGDHQRARQLLEKCIQQLAPGSLRAEAVSLLAVVRLYDEGYLEAADLLQRALSEVGDKLNLRVPVLVMLSWALFNAGRLDDAVATAHEAVVCAERLGEPHPLSQALSMRVLMDFLRGDGFDEARMQTALELADNEFYAPMPFRPKVQNALLLAFTGQLERASAEMRSIRRDAMENGDEGELSVVTFHRVLVECWLGNFADANLAAEDTMEIGLQVGRDVAVISALIARGWLGAYAGREPEARRDVADALAAGQRSGTFRLVQWAITALGFLELSLGNSKAALDTLQPLLSDFAAAPDSIEIVAASFIPDAVEAMTNLGHLDDAEPLIEALERNGRRLDRAWMLAVGARCRAMLLAARGELTVATTTAERAMTEHERLPMPFERARTQLLLGQLQRRQRHRDASTATLGEALQTFEQLGATLWVDRAKAELARGMSGRLRAEGLTPSEQRVAELAVSGMTNRDIAATLFISPKTVEVNLSRIYRKLNIRSRMGLYRALESTHESPKQ